FFFQAEDGIRDLTVTGVQTCALPIFRLRVVVLGELREGDVREHWIAARRQHPRRSDGSGDESRPIRGRVLVARRAREPYGGHVRSEERRVGKGGRSRWAECR